MGTQLLQFLSPFPISRVQQGNPQLPYRASRRCYSDGRSGGSRWDWDRTVNANQRPRFREEFATSDYDYEDEFGFTNAGKQRIWWSDDYAEGEEDEDEDEEFGVLEGTIGFNWILKVFQAFGWMLPAIIISMLVGTGPNAIIMAIALPLAQSALSFVADAIWGRSYYTPRPKSKTKKKPFARPVNGSRVRKENERGNQSRKVAEDYQSWVAAKNVASKNASGRTQNFGGWDELDQEINKVNQKTKESRVEKNIKVSRRTKAETPLLVRLLIAVFPFLGFWNKLL